MSYPNSGFLLPRKAEGKQPNCTGTINIGEDLVDYINKKYKEGGEIILDLAGWTRLSEKGAKYLSVSIKKPYDKVEGGTQSSGRKVTVEDDEEIPF